MGFDQRQRKALRAKLRFANVRTRVHNGTTLHYIEGWQAVAEANRIFGHENWDRETHAPTCIWSDRQRGQLVCLYSSQVRITVRAGDMIVTRDGVGTGFGRASSPETAHEIAMKAAETDATKRALATFGNPFGLALYDKDMSQVTRPPKRDRYHNDGGSNPRRPKVVLAGRNGQQLRLSNTIDLLDAVAKALPDLETVAAVYAFWEANLPIFAAVLERDPKNGRKAIDGVTARLKARLRDLGGTTPDERSAYSSPPVSAPRDGTVADTSSLEPPIPLMRAKERRVRDADHLAFVARHSCLICGRRPAQAHHIRFAQPRAMAMKVSDEFTVPLCVGHHDAVHRVGDERAWWAARRIDPLAVALRLWTTNDKSSEFPTFGCQSPADIETPDTGGSKRTDASEMSQVLAPSDPRRPPTTDRKDTLGSEMRTKPVRRTKSV